MAKGWTGRKVQQLEQLRKGRDLVGLAVHGGLARGACGDTLRNVGGRRLESWRPRGWRRLVRLWDQHAADTHPRPPTGLARPGGSA